MDLDQEELPPPADASTIAVVGSGNLGLVWFTGNDHRLTVEELEELHPEARRRRSPRTPASRC